MTEKTIIAIAKPLLSDDLKNHNFQKQIINSVEKELKELEHKEFFKQQHYSPVVNFEKETGLAGISGKYKMPDGKTHETVEFEHQKESRKYIFATARIKEYASFLPSHINKQLAVIAEEGQKVCLPKMLKNFDKLVKLNPELKKLEVDRTDIEKVNDVIFGITSRFNVDDINGFLKREEFYSETKESKLHNEMEERTGVDIQWHPCLSTLKKIEIQVYKKEKSKSQEMKITALKQQNTR